MLPLSQSSTRWAGDGDKEAMLALLTAALFDLKDPFNEAVAASYVQASGGLGDLYAPVLSLTAGDAERLGLLRFILIEALDADAAVTATELLRFGHSWTAVHAIHAARPSAAHLDQ